MSRMLVICVAALLSMNTSFASGQKCGDPATAKSNVDSLDNDIVQLRDQRKAREASVESQIDAVAKSLIDSGKWTESDHAQFFSKLLKSSDFTAFEKQKKTELTLYGYAAETMVTRRSQGNWQLACVSANDMRGRLVNIGAVNDKQYEFMLQEVKAAAEKLR